MAVDTALADLTDGSAPATSPLDPLTGPAVSFDEALFGQLVMQPVAQVPIR